MRRWLYVLNAFKCSNYKNSNLENNCYWLFIIVITRIYFHLERPNFLYYLMHETKKGVNIQWRRLKYFLQVKIERVIRKWFMQANERIWISWQGNVEFLIAHLAKSSFHLSSLKTSSNQSILIWCLASLIS